MRPSAFLFTMSRYRGVTKRLRDVKAAFHHPGLDLCVETGGDFDDIPPLMRSAVDLIALDGHGWPDGKSAYFGTSDDPSWLSIPFCPEYLRSEHGDGIVAPIVVLGFCWGGKDPFISALEGSLGRSNAAFLGSVDKTRFDDAERIYLPILRLLAELGSSPDPGSAHTRLKSIAPSIGLAWRSELLSRRNDP